MWEAAVTGLQITKAPDKTTYVEGDAIDLTGMVVTATVNGQETTLDNGLLIVSPTTFTQTGSVTVTVSFGGQSATFTVQVNKYVPPEPEDITIETTLEDGMTQRGSRRTFDVIARDARGEKIPVSELTVKLNGTTVRHNWDDDEKTSYTLVFSREGKNTVTITALTRTDTYTINYEKAADGEVIGQAVFSMEAFTLGGGYLIEPCFVDILEGENSAQLLDRVLRENDFTYSNTGTLESGFYLASITGDAVEKVDPSGAGVPQVLLDKIGKVSERREADSLGEFDHKSASGWMYCVNCVFPNVGFSDYYMGDGDVMRVQFTLALGSDIGGGKATGGGGGAYYTIADKDELTTRIAEIGVENVPDAVLAVVYKLDATQSEVNDALDALDNPEEQPDTPTIPDSVTSEVNPKVTVDKDGTAAVKLTGKDVDAALKEAAADKADTLVIKPEIEGEASKVVVELPKSSVSDIVGDSLNLTVSTPIAGMTIPSEGLSELAKQSGSTVSFTAETVTVTGADGSKSDAIRLDVAVNGKSVDTVPGGLTVTVPAADSGSVLVLVAEDGTETIIRKSVTADGAVAGLVDGPCTVKIVDNAKTFTDTSGHWAADAIDFASSRELFNGTSATAFSPNEEMTRAMLVTVLHRMEDEAETAAENAFADVPDDTWYTDAVLWASENGIVNGVAEGQFDPDANITREQLAAMMYRYADFLGMDTAASGSLSRFHDGSQVSPWASDAMKWAVRNGLISGKIPTILDPKGNATRAEVATILQRMTALMVK